MNPKSLKSDLLSAWIVWGSLFFMLAVYIYLCLNFGQQIRFQGTEKEPVLIRTILYVVAIASFPMTNLIRHIMLRINQTMPGDTPAKSRYFTTALVSMSMASTLGIYGFILFLLGDNINTLYIFCSLSALALFLYRPKPEEYCDVIEAVKQMKND